MQTISYQEFSSHFNQKLAPDRLPLSGTVEITHRCPLTCAHCYNNLPMADQTARRQELSYQEHCRLVDEITDAGCLWLLYTGGEIFARKDFLDIYTYAKKKGLLITLFTNGTILTPGIADHLAQWRPFSIEITLYGRTRETYEKLTGIPGSYERCMKGIRLLMERKLPLKLKTVAVSINKHEIWEMKRFTEEELGLEFKFDAMINPRIDCSQSPLATRLKPEEIVALDLDDPRRREAMWRFTQQSIDRMHQRADRQQLYQCGGGIKAFAVDPYGRISICVLSHFDTYDWRRGSFREGWDNFLFKVRNKKRNRLTKCVACGLKEMCGMCPANGELENQEAEAPVDFLCHVAHLRAHALGLEIPSHGECEYCAGGEYYSDLLRSLAALENGALREELLAIRQSQEALLPILGATEVPSATGCSSGGCPNCG